MKINIPEGYVIDKTKSTFENIVFKKEVKTKPETFEDIFLLNNTTWEKFKEQYKNIDKADRDNAVERLMVKAYNGDWTPNWNNSNEVKYYPYFKMSGDSFGFYFCYHWYTLSDVSSRFCFKNKEDLLDAVERFKEVYKRSRT